MRIGKREFTVTVAPYDGGNLAFVEDGDAIDVIGDWAPGEPLLIADMDGRRRVVQVAKQGPRLDAARPAARGTRCRSCRRHIAELSQHMIEKVPPDLSRFLLAPMPGLLTRLEVKAGDKVEAGQPVAVVEAMKMENILRAEKPRRSRRPRPRPATAWRSTRSSWSSSDRASREQAVHRAKAQYYDRRAACGSVGPLPRRGQSAFDEPSAFIANGGVPLGIATLPCGSVAASADNCGSGRWQPASRLASGCRIYRTQFLSSPAGVSPSPSSAARRQTRFRADICKAQSLP